jgi:hypothetical protein
VFLDRRHELLRGHVAAEVVDLEARPLQHHADQVLADVVQVALRGTDHDDAVVVVGLGGGGDERLQQIEPGVHGPCGQQHLGHVVLVAAELLSDHVHAGDEPFKNELLGVHGQIEPFARLACHRLAVPEDERA